MTEAATKAAKHVAPKPKIDKTPAPVKAPAVQAPAAAAPKTAGTPPASEVLPVAKKAVEQTAKATKPSTAKKTKLVRDSFTMPELEYAAIATLKKRCLHLGVAAKKSEILRAAIAALAKMSDADVAAAIQGLEVIKTGRPAKGAK